MKNENCPCAFCYSHCKTMPGDCLFYCFYCKQMAKNNGVFFCWYCCDFDLNIEDGRVLILAIIFAIVLIVIVRISAEISLNKKTQSLKKLSEETEEIRERVRAETREKAKKRKEDTLAKIAERERIITGNLITEIENERREQRRREAQARYIINRQLGNKRRRNF